MKCVVIYTSVDGVRKKRPYWSLAGAQKWCHRMLGESPEISWGFHYAISDDGIGKIEVDGDWTLRDIFPKSEHPPLPGEKDKE
jgi:hypothetical protein